MSQTQPLIIQFSSLKPTQDALIPTNSGLDNTSQLLFTIAIGVVKSNKNHAFEEEQFGDN